MATAAEVAQQPYHPQGRNDHSQMQDQNLAFDPGHRPSGREHGWDPQNALSPELEPIPEIASNAHYDMIGLDHLTPRRFDDPATSGGWDTFDFSTVNSWDIAAGQLQDLATINTNAGLGLQYERDGEAEEVGNELDGEGEEEEEEDATPRSGSDDDDDDGDNGEFEDADDDERQVHRNDDTELVLDPFNLETGQHDESSAGMSNHVDSDEHQGLSFHSR